MARTWWSRLSEPPCYLRSRRCLLFYRANWPSGCADVQRKFRPEPTGTWAQHRPTTCGARPGASPLRHRMTARRMGSPRPRGRGQARAARRPRQASDAVPGEANPRRNRSSGAARWAAPRAPTSVVRPWDTTPLPAAGSTSAPARPCTRTSQRWATRWRRCRRCMLVWRSWWRGTPSCGGVTRGNGSSSPFRSHVLHARVLRGALCRRHHCRRGVRGRGDGRQRVVRGARYQRSPHWGRDSADGCAPSTGRAGRDDPYRGTAAALTWSRWPPSPRRVALWGDPDHPLRRASSSQRGVPPQERAARPVGPSGDASRSS